MKSIHLVNTLLVVFLLCLVYPVHAQVNQEAIEFKKTVEPHQLVQGLHNTRGKTSLQKRFSGDENGMMEFFIEPSFSGASGFVMNPHADSGYTLKVKWVSNWEEVQEKMAVTYPVKPSDMKTLESKSEEERQAILTYNRGQLSQQSNKAVSEYNIESRSIPVSAALAEQLYESTVTLTRDHSNKGVPYMSHDGYTAQFRCVVGDEVWNFWTKNPLGAFGKLTTICKEIIKEVQESGGIKDEEVYIQRLVPPASSQNENAVMFKKTVEPTEHAGVQNVRSKDALQLKFFPDNTGFIEFFEAPEHRPGYGFRMIRTEDSRYLLEIKEVSNWQEIKKRIDEAFPLQIPSKTLSREERDEMNKTYKENARKRAEAWKAAIQEYKIMSKNISVSNAFANAMHGAFIYSIRNYDNRGHSFMQFGGSQVTLRCTVENELWSFDTRSPIDKVAVLTDISNAIFKEAIEKGEVDEDKYMKQLKELVKDEQD